MLPGAFLEHVTSASRYDRLSRLRSLLSIATGAWLCSSFAALSPALAAEKAVAAAKPGNVAVELVSDIVAIVPGKPFRVGLRMRHDAHWHTYWRNPGDAGTPTTLAWTLPSGFRAGDIEWPFPERLQRGPLASFGYQGDLLLPVLIFPPRDVAAKSTLMVDARWLECNDSCIPRQAQLSLTLPDGAKTPTRSTQAAAFALARERMVQAAEGLSATARIRGDMIDVTLAVPPGMGRQGELFIEPEDIVEPGAIPLLSDKDGKLVWSSRLTPNGRKSGPGVWPAVWVATAPTGVRRGYRVDISLPWAPYAEIRR